MVAIQAQIDPYLICSMRANKFVENLGNFLSAHFTPETQSRVLVGWESSLVLYVLHIRCALVRLDAIQVIGAGLTGSILSFALFQHRHNREQQSRLLRQQALLVRSIVDPRIVSVDDAERITGNRDHPTRKWKDRWNGEVENAVKWCHTLQWDDLRNGITDKVDKVKNGIRRI